MAKCIIFDGGKKNVKALCLINGELAAKVIFPSLTKPITLVENEEVNSELSFLVKINDNYFKAGEGVLANYNFQKSKVNIHSKVLLHAVIDYFCENNETIDVVIGCPSTDYATKENRTNMSNYFKENGNLKINVNSKEKNIIINNVTICSEGLALRPRMILANKFKSFHVLDMGGLNINYKQYDNKGNILISTSLDKAGSNQLVNYLRVDFRSSMRTNSNINIDSIDYEDCIRKKAFPYESLAPNFLYKNIFNFISDKVVNELRGLGTDIDETGIPIIFTGGSSQLLEPYLKDIIENKDKIFSTTFIWDNCISYAVKYIMSLKLEKKEEMNKIKLLFGEKQYE